MVYPKRLLILALVLTTAACSGPATPEPTPESLEALASVPSDARMVGYVNAASLRETLDELVQLAPSGELAEMWEQLQEGMAQTGMDPERDLRYAVGFVSQESAPSVVMVGTFDADRIGTFIEQEMPEVIRSQQSGMTVWSAPDQNPGVKPSLGISEDGTRAFLGISPAALVGGQSPSTGPELARLAAPVMAHDSWMVMRDLPSLPDSSVGGEMGVLARAVSDLALGANLDVDSADGVAVLYPKSGVSAKDLASLVRGVLSALRAQDLPQIVRNELEHIKVNDADGVVRVSGSITRASVEAVFTR